MFLYLNVNLILNLMVQFLLDGCGCACCGFGHPGGRLTGMNGWSSKRRWSRQSHRAAIKGAALLWGPTAVDHKWLLWCCKGQSGSMGCVMKMEAAGPQRFTLLSYLTICRWRLAMDRSCSKGRVFCCCYVGALIHEDYTWHLVLEVFQSWCY